MAALSSLSDLVNRLTGGNSGTPENLFFFRNPRISGTSITAPVAGAWHSAWQWDGIQGGGGATPGAAAVPTRATTGALGQANPGGGRTKWLLSMAVAASQPGTVLLYDRLLACGGLSGTVTTAQTVGGSLTRNTSGAGNQIWVEVNALIGTTGRTITASYTNQAGASGQTTQATAIGGTGLREAGRMIQLPLAAGDSGVQAVASVTLSGSTGTAGDFGVVIARPIAFIGCPATGVGPVRSFVDGLAIPSIDTDACLAFAWQAGTTTGPTLSGALAMVEA